MIEPNATQIKAQAIEIHLSGSGWWNLYDARGQLVARAKTLASIVEHAQVKFFVRATEWRTVQVVCDDCTGHDDNCAKCGGHGTVYRDRISA